MGGAAGSGKSWALLFEPIRHVNNGDFSAVIFRRSIKDIKRPGGLIDESQKETMYGHPKVQEADPRFNSTDRVWKFKSGAQVKFAHLGKEKELSNWQGSQIPLICWDELTHFSERMFFYLLSRNRSTCGVDPYVRATCNPDPDSWVKGFISWFLQENGQPDPERAGQLRYFARDGNDIVQASSKEQLIENYPHIFDSAYVTPDQLVKSFTFIPGNVYDNEELLKKNPQYLANLKSLPTAERKKLLGGNWNVRQKEGEYFKSDYFEHCKLTKPELPGSYDRIIRTWDMAETKPSNENPDPDYTVGLLVGKYAGELYVLDMARFRDNPAGNERRIKETAKSDKLNYDHVEQHIERPPGTGKTYIHQWQKTLAGHEVEGHYSNKSKERRAVHASSAASNGLINVREAHWNDPFFRELYAFGAEPAHDDITDALVLAHRVLNESRVESGSLYIDAL